MSDLKQQVEQILQMLGDLKKQYPAEFEYIVAGTVHHEGMDKHPISFNAYNLNTIESIPFYIKQLQRHYEFCKEIERFNMLKWSKTCLVVCVLDELPKDLSPHQVQLKQWVKSYETYRCTALKANYDTKQLCLILETLDGEKIVPPLPYEGFDSRRFVIANYAKLN